MKIILFAITGFGNKAIDVLLANGCNVAALFTRPGREESSFYPGTENICLYAESKGIKVYENYDWLEAERVIEKIRPELLLVDTYHRIIPAEVFESLPLAVNVHPSLLPKYRGSTPIDWVLYNQEKETGISIHKLSAEFDRGAILVQRRIIVSPSDDKASLTKKLINLSGLAIETLIAKMRQDDLRASAQDESMATVFPNFNKLSDYEKNEIKKEYDKIRS